MQQPPFNQHSRRGRSQGQHGGALLGVGCNHDGGHYAASSVPRGGGGRKGYFQLLFIITKLRYDKMNNFIIMHNKIMHYLKLLFIITNCYW